MRFVHVTMISDVRVRFRVVVVVVVVDGDCFNYFIIKKHHLLR